MEVVLGWAPQKQTLIQGCVCSDSLRKCQQEKRERRGGSRTARWRGSRLWSSCRRGLRCGRAPREPLDGPLYFMVCHPLRQKQLGFCSAEPVGHQLWVCPGETRARIALSESGEAAWGGGGLTKRVPGGKYAKATGCPYGTSEGDPRNTQRLTTVDLVLGAQT